MNKLDKILIINSDASRIKEWDNRYQLGFCINNISEGHKECKVIRIKEEHINIAELKGMLCAIEYALYNVNNFNEYEVSLFSDNMFVSILLKECIKVINSLSEEEKYALLKHDVFIPNNKMINYNEFSRLNDSLKRQNYKKINHAMKLMLLLKENNSINVKWIPRRENHIADKLSKMGEKQFEYFSLETACE